MRPRLWGSSEAMQKQRDAKKEPGFMRVGRPSVCCGTKTSAPLMRTLPLTPPLDGESCKSRSSPGAVPLGAAVGSRYGKMHQRRVHPSMERKPPCLYSQPEWGADALARRMQRLMASTHMSRSAEVEAAQT